MPETKSTTTSEDSSSRKNCTKVDHLDARHHVEDLPAARELLLDRRLDRAVVAHRDARLDRHAAGGRRGERRHGADAGHAHVHRARDGRGGEGEDVDVGRGLLDLLLLAHAEALLLVDDEQAEVLELDLVREQRVRPHEHLHLAARHVLADRGRLGRPLDEARDELDAHVGHPLQQDAVVLRGEDGRRREERDLPARADGAVDARIATSVLPKPTSPHTSRSIGCVLSIMSAATSPKTVVWSGVGVKGKAASNLAIRSPSGPHGGRLSSCRSAYILTRSAATAHTLPRAPCASSTSASSASRRA